MFEFCFFKMEDEAKSSKILVFTLISLVALIPLVMAHSLGMGACPKVQPFKSFEMEYFNGSWFVIQKTDTSSTCLMYNFVDSEDGKSRLIQSSKHYILGKVGIDDFTYTGVLTTPDTGDPARMKVKFPMKNDRYKIGKLAENIVGEADLIISDTDYDTYGVVYSCQKLFVGHTKSCTILSRTPTLNDTMMDMIYNKIKSVGLTPSDMDLDTINHSKCGVGGEDDYNLQIDDKTFHSRSSDSNSDVGRKVGLAALPAGAAYGYARSRRRKPLG